MQRDSFVNECRRLYSGCSKGADLTAERLHVLWEMFGSTEAETWCIAVDLMLLEHRIPNAVGFSRAIERAELVAQQRRAAKHNAEAKGWVGRVAQAAQRSDSNVAREAIAAILRMIAETPEWEPLEPWWERVGQRPGNHDWRNQLNRNREQRGLPTGPPWTCGHPAADAFWADGHDVDYA